MIFEENQKWIAIFSRNPLQIYIKILSKGMVAEIQVRNSFSYSEAIEVVTET